MADNNGTGTDNNRFGHTLSNQEIERYSRQLILNDFGVTGQEKLNKSSVLIVGAGGLGCPVAMYLAAAGVGHLGVVDYDFVELNNLHRQIAHTEKNVNLSKAKSLQQFCLNLNSNIKCTTYELQLNNRNALDLIEQYDVICDCTDNVPTRYLLNDACVLAKKPLISGSALRWEGQLVVYGYKKGPCYRCIFPQPPPPETVVGCSEGGVLGVVPGIIGNMQALEVLKILIDIETSFSNKMLLFDGLRGTFRAIKMRPRNPQCLICGKDPQITKLMDYELMCGMGACDKVKPINELNPEDRISIERLRTMLKDKEPLVLVDCRPEHEYKICHLKPSLCLPLHNIMNDDRAKLKGDLDSSHPNTSKEPILVICHHGNDSQLAVKRLRHVIPGRCVLDVEGGLDQWAKSVDTTFPRY